MQTITRRPAIDGQLGWFETVPFSRPHAVRKVTVNSHYDYLIIGAGFSGLAVTGRLAELAPFARIALVDALEIGQGTSGRNAGFIIDLPHNLDSSKPDPEGDRQVRNLNVFAIERLRRLANQSGLDVQWDNAGKYLVAHEEKHFSALESFATNLKAIGETFEELSQSELRDRLGTSYYKRGIYTPGNILMNPAALAQAVASVLPDNVTLYEKSPVQAIDIGKKTATFERAQLSADKLILATNAYTEEFGGCSNRLAPVFTYASLTRQLSPSELAKLGDIAPWGLTSAHPAGTTARLTSDHRIFIRNTLDFLPELASTENHLGKARKIHTQSFKARFPGLADVPFEYSWGGMLCMTMNHQSVFKKHSDDVYVVAAMNGVGVAKGTYLGNYMAEYIQGVDSPELDFILNNSNPSWVPPDPFRSIGARVRLSFEEKLAKGEV